jgi:hypothetical protein
VHTEILGPKGRCAYWDTGSGGQVCILGYWVRRVGVCILGYWVRRVGVHTGILGQEGRCAYWDTGSGG